MLVESRYAAGQGLLLAADRRWLLTAHPQDEAFVEELWRAMTLRHDPVAMVVGMLSQRALPLDPDFALLDLSAENAHLLSRGRCQARRLEGADGEVFQLKFAELTAARPSHPLSQGMVLADGVEVRRSPGVIDGIPPTLLADRGLDAGPPPRPGPSAPPPAPPVAPQIAPQVGQQGGPLTDHPTAPTPMARRLDSQDQAARAGRDSADTPEPPAPPVTVLGVYCAQGHPNRPEAAHCQQCPAAIPPQQPQSMVRPAIGRLRLSSGAGAVLDRGCVIGRRPSRSPELGEAQRLITVPSDFAYVSRLHAMIQLDGWAVQVCDLGSRGGTVLRPDPRSGRPALTLIPYQPMPWCPGDILELAEEFTVSFDGPGGRVVAPDSPVMPQ